MTFTKFTVYCRRLNKFPTLSEFLDTLAVSSKPCLRFLSTYVHILLVLSEHPNWMVEPKFSDCSRFCLDSDSREVLSILSLIFPPFTYLAYSSKGTLIFLLLLP